MKEILDIVMTIAMVGFFIFIVNGYYQKKMEKEYDSEDKS